MKIIHSLLFLVLFCSTLMGQNTSNNAVLQVFLDNIPDEEFTRSELNWISFTRNRQDADVHIQITPEYTFGRRVGVYFFGENRFEGQNDTIWYEFYPGENKGVVRQKRLLAMQQGLLPYLLKTGMKDYLNFSKADDPQLYYPKENPWGQRIWVVGLSGTGSHFSENYANIDIFNRSFNSSTSVNAYKISEKWRESSSIFFSNTIEKTKYRDVQRQRRYSWGAEGSFDLAYSLTEHFSLGVWCAAKHNSAAPEPNDPSSDRIVSSSGFTQIGFEYSLLPYKDFFRRNLIVGTFAGLKFSSSNVVSREYNYAQSVHLSGRIEQKWGFFGGRSLLSYDYTPGKPDYFGTNFYLNTGINLRRNLVYTASLGFGWSKNGEQLSNPDIPPSPNQRSSYIRLNFGLIYTFGSTYRNVVNPIMRPNLYNSFL